jgi:hypothetical protein
MTGITKQQLLEAYRIAAQVVALYGDAYLPAFERLHKEMEKCNQSDEIKTIALNIASGIINADGR